MIGRLEDLVGRLREAVGPGEAGTLSDGELLCRWLQQRDQGAFELLVWRHGRLVLSVCRRLLGNAADVEDAFQATFLILVRKGSGIARGQALASWLHAVACRVALQARARWARHEPADTDRLEQVPARSDGAVEEREVREVLDEEVRRLPEKYRLPFVLCYLEGRTNEEAARELGRPVGTIASRLARARERLHARLARRGLTPSATLLGPGLSSLMPGGLVGPTVRAALALTAHESAGGAVSAPVAVLMEGALRAMFFAKVKAAFAVVLSVAVLGVGGGVTGYRVASAQPTNERGSVVGRGLDTRGESASELEQLKKELDEAMARVEQLKKALDRAARARTADKVPKKQADPKGQPRGGRGMGGMMRGSTTGGMMGPSGGLGNRESAEVLSARLDVKKAEVLVARTAVNKAKSRMARVRKLAEQKVVSADEMEEAQANHDAASAQLQVKEAELRESQILLEQARRRGGMMMGGGSAAKPSHSLEERIQTLEKKVEKLELLQKRAAGGGGGFGKRS